MNRIDLEATDLTAPELAELVKNGTLVLTSKGKPLAVVKRVAGDDWESISLANNPRFVAIIEESRRSYKEHGGIDMDETRRELGLSSKSPKKGTKRKRTSRT